MINTESINQNSSFSTVSDIAAAKDRIYTIQPDKKYLFGKLAQIILIRPFVKSTELALRTVKDLTYVPLKALVLAVSKGGEASKNYMGEEIVSTIKVARDIFVIPEKAIRIMHDLRTAPIQYTDSNKSLKPKDYLNTEYIVSYQHYTAKQFPNKNVKIITPQDVGEAAAIHDSSLKAVMASHIFKPGTMGIDFGCPNLALFTVHQSKNGESEVRTIDAKSLKREKMVYKDSHGKMQSGVFFIPTNLPEDAIKALEEAAIKLQGRCDYSCVNTNCRVLKEAGFTMEGVDLADCYLPATFMEHILNRKMFYKGQIVHFDVVKTTPLTLDEYAKKIDTATLTTPARHLNRHNDSQAAKDARSEAAKKQFVKEEIYLKANKKHIKDSLQAEDAFKSQEVKVGISSHFGDFFARIWGRHTVFEINLSDHKDAIAKLFPDPMLKPFPQTKPSFATRIKRDVLFSKPMIHFLRGHMLGDQVLERMDSGDILRLLKNTNGVRLNYTLLPDRVIITRIEVAADKHKKVNEVADWALSKHALLANREDVHCAGEMWFDNELQKIYINVNSGTYVPDKERLEKTVQLANAIFKSDCFVGVN